MRMQYQFGTDLHYYVDLQDRDHALEVLKEAVERTVDEDMRTDDVFAALEYLKGPCQRYGALLAFRDALSIEHPMRRETALKARLSEIKIELRRRL